MMDYITGPEWAEKVPKELPVYNIAGDQDPVGQYGTGVLKVSNWFIDAGVTDVFTELYPGYRHEIHNYSDIKYDVGEMLIDFLNKEYSDVS